MAERIGIDATLVSIDGKGVSRRTVEFLRALAVLPSQHRFAIFLNKKARLPDLPHPSHFRYLPVPFPPFFVWEQLRLPQISAKYRLSLLHTPYDRLPLFGGGALIAHYPEIPDYRLTLGRAKPRSWQTRLSEQLTRILFPISLKKAAAIVVSSQSTRRDFIQKYGVPPEKIKIVYEAAGPQFKPASLEERRRIQNSLETPAGYVLHFASGDPRDNTETVLAAYAQAEKADHQIPPLLIAVRENRLWEEMKRHLHSLKISHKVRRAEADHEAQLLSLYQGARVYFDPSLFEGFGLQVIEAMACGIPVLTSDTTSLPEVAGDAAVTAHPLDSAAFGQALLSICGQASREAEMRRKSLAQSQKFSWTRHAEEMLGVYQDVLENRRPAAEKN